MKSFIDIIFPPECAICGKLNRLLCETCLTELIPVFNIECSYCQKIYRTNTQKCSACSKNMKILSIFTYERNIRKIIRSSKYGKKEFANLEALCLFAAKILKEAGFSFEENTVLVPIPLHKGKYKSRGFNQAEIIAKILAKEFDVTHQKDLLVRKKETKPQFSQNKLERRLNLENAFAVQKEQLKNVQSIVLIDDIYTSGATLIEAAESIEKHTKLKSISGLTISKGVLRKRSKL